MENKREHIIPSPIIDRKEETSLVALTERYNKLIEPGMLSKVGSKISSIIPEPVKRFGGNVKDSITEAELFSQCMKVVAEGFNVLEKQAAKMSISEEGIVKKINKTLEGYQIKKLEEVCFVRGYHISKSVSSYKMQDLGFALAEGGATGYFGFAGLPFKELTAVKQTAKKTWTEMAKRGGVGLLLTQMRALANKSAQKALEKAGQKGLENSLFKEIFEQIGKKLTKKALGKAIPVAGAVISALFDVEQMNTILEYADVFYNKRYILEKEERINVLLGIENEIIEDAVTIEKCIE